MIKKRADFIKVKIKGKMYRSNSLILQKLFDKRLNNTLRVGYTATKKLGSATKRNRAKRLMRELVKRDIHLNISYPWPIHTMIGYEYLGCKAGDLPITEKRAQEIFSLPMYPTLSDKDQTFVIESLKEII